MSDGRQEKPTTSRPQEPTLQREGSARELPEAVKNLIEARTGDAVYVVDPDYRIVHWDSQMESLTGRSRRKLWDNLVTKPSWASGRTGDLSVLTVAR